MTIEVGGAGELGMAFETTLGTFVAPAKWIPIRSESLQLVEDKIYRTNIRGLAERSGAIPGYTHVEGDIVFEVTPDALLYFLYSGRYSIVKTGAGPYEYVFTPVAVAKTSTAVGATTRKTLSILIERGGNGFGYVGMALGQISLTVDGGVLIATASMVGVDEDTQSLAAATYGTVQPMGPGNLTLEVPDATARADADTFTATINDNLVNANRLNGQRKAAYQNWGEREITLDFEIDFDTRTGDYTKFRAQTIEAVTLIGTSPTTNEDFELAFSGYVIDSVATPLAGLGEVNRATISGHGIYNSAASHTWTVNSTTSIA